MDRMIRIQSCQQCRHCETAGGFSQLPGLPHCMGCKKPRELPHTLHTVPGRPGFGPRAQASPTYKIPDWCPLEKAPKRVEEPEGLYGVGTSAPWNE